MAFLFIFGHALLAHLVGGCGARAVSRKTTINFILHCLYMFFFYRQRLYHSPKHRFTRCLLSMMGFAVPLFDDLFVWRLNEFKDDLVWLQHDNWSDLHSSSVTQCSLSYCTYWAFPFSRVFCLTSPHMLLSELALVKLEILKRSVIENWPLKVLTKYICSLKNNRTENVRGQFVDFVRKKRENREEGKQAGWTGINGSLLS